MATVREVVVIDAVRSAIGKSGMDGMKKNGQLCQASSQELLANTMRGLLNRVKARSGKFDEHDIEDVIIGCLSQIGEQGSDIARFASLLAGIPKEACGCTVNQFCNAGLKAIMFGAQSIQVGNGDVVLCGGVEVMSHYPIWSDIEVAKKAEMPVRFTSRLSEIGMDVAQGMCAEKISADEGHTREDLDHFGMWSMQKAICAQRNGWFDNIIPYEYKWDGQVRRAEVDEVLRAQAVDEPEVYWEGLCKLKTPFKADGRVTPGNASQIVDGAARRAADGCGQGRKTRPAAYRGNPRACCGGRGTDADVACTHSRSEEGLCALRPLHGRHGHHRAERSVRHAVSRVRK